MPEYSGVGAGMGGAENEAFGLAGVAFGKVERGVGLGVYYFYGLGSKRFAVGAERREGEVIGVVVPIIPGLGRRKDKPGTRRYISGVFAACVHSILFVGGEVHNPAVLANSRSEAGGGDVYRVDVGANMRCPMAALPANGREFGLVVREIKPFAGRQQ